MSHATPSVRHYQRFATAFGIALLAFTVGLLHAGRAGADTAPRMLGAVVPAGGAAPSIRTTPSRFAAQNLTYHGGSVMRTSTVYAIYWVPSGYAVSSAYQSTITKYLQDVAAASGSTTNVYGNDTQYTDSTGPIANSTSFGGSYVDTTAFPTSGCTDPGGRPVCLSDAQIRSEITSVLGRRSWTPGPNKLFFVFTPRNVGSCFGSSCAYTAFCAYHSWSGSGASVLLYANQPYAGGNGSCDQGEHPNGDEADGTINVLSHEHIEAITDPQGTGWYDASGEEIADKCAWNFGATLGGSTGTHYNQVINGGHYYLQQEWDNTTSSCVLQQSTNATLFSVVAPANSTAGQTVNVTVTARPFAGRIATTYTGTVHFSSSDGAAELPADYTFTTADRGVHTFRVRLMSAGAGTVTVTDIADGSIAGTSEADTVAAGLVTALAVSAPTTATVDTGFPVDVTATNAFGAPVAGYTGTVHFATSDGNTYNPVSLPGDYTFTSGSGRDNGTHRFTGVKLETARTQTLAVVDTAVSSIKGSARLVVSRATTSTLYLSQTAAPIAGKAYALRVYAIDAGGNVDPTYDGTVHFTSTDDEAELPTDATFGVANKGVATFSIRLMRAGSQSVTVTDGAHEIDGTVSATVDPGTVARLAVSAPATVSADDTFSVTVTALNRFGATIAGYADTVHFSSNDGNTTTPVLLPDDLTFSASDDHGSHTFSNAVTLETAGRRTITVVDGSGARGSARVTVVPGSPEHLEVATSTTASRGSTRSLRVIVRDNGGNIVSDYAGTVTFTSTDSGATLPAGYTFDPGEHGRHVFAVVFASAGTQTVSATDAAHSATGTSNAVAVR